MRNNVVRRLTTDTLSPNWQNFDVLFPPSDGMPFQVLFVGKKRGKGVVATRNITKGEIIVRNEQPLASGQYFVNKRHVLTCAHCMRFLEYHPYALVWDLPYAESFRVQPHPTIIECDNRCNSAYYCSVECKTEAWEKYHKYLCPSSHPEILKLYKDWRSLENKWKDVFPKLSPSMFIKVVTEYLASLRTPELNLRLGLPQSHHTLQEYLSILSTTPAFMEEPPSWSKAIRHMTSLLPKFFSDMSFSSEEMTKLEDIVRRLVYNSRPIVIPVSPSFDNYLNILKLKKIPKAKLNIIKFRLVLEETDYMPLFWQPTGSALYLVQACFNHSCKPNASAKVGETHHQNIVALENISKGTEITISYLPNELLQTSYSRRQKMIRMLFGFECMCARCVAGA